MSIQGNPAIITLQNGKKYKLSAQGNKEDDAGKGAITVTGPDTNVILPVRGSRRFAFTVMEPQGESETSRFELLFKNADKDPYAEDKVFVSVHKEEDEEVIEIIGIREEDEEPLIRATCRPE